MSFFIWKYVLIILRVDAQGSKTDMNYLLLKTEFNILKKSVRKFQGQGMDD